MSATPSVVPAVAIESEKENKKDLPKRKVKETQKRLGVGKPRIAGGTGARNVTRIIPSRSTRNRSREDVAGDGVVVEMDAVIEEGEEGQFQFTPSAASHC